MGISIGIMKPDPRSVLFEDRCPGCRRVVRGLGPGVVGEVGPVLAQCDCGEAFYIRTEAKELDS